MIVYGLIVIAVMGNVLMDNRQPAKTMAWMLVLIFLPVLGIILYFFFGQNTRKERLISQNSLDQLTKRSMLGFAEQRDMRYPLEYENLIKLFTKENWAFPFKDNEIDVYTDGYQYFHALLRDISQARHHIHIDSYIFEDDALGTMVADALIQKAGEGVEVRVVYDDVGSWKVKSSFFERMRDAGIEVHGFMPVKFPAFTSKVNYRNHRKISVIDGRVGYIGGMNIATRYVQGRNGQAWRDTHLRIRGGGVYGIQRAFLIDWYFVDRTLITNRQYYPEFKLGDTQLSLPPGDMWQSVSRNDCLVQIVTSSPVAEWPSIMQGYTRILLQARKYVYMETPYFLPTDPVLFAMRTAALSGVDVRLMIPKKSDAKYVEWGSRSFVREAVESGIKVYLYTAGFNHSKFLVSDDLLCTCGSTNVDFRSFENNFEGNAFIYNREMAMRMKEVFMADVAQSQLLDEEQYLLQRPFYKRLWESIVRLFSPLL